MSRTVYLDHHATTPLDERVLAAMRPWLTTECGNASSAHRLGSSAAAAVESARIAVAALLGAHDPDEIVFTSGATESNQLAIVGVALKARQLRGARHVLTTAVEHKSVFSAMEYLVEHHGFTSSIVPVDRAGRVDPATIAAAVTTETAVLSTMVANNEIGTIQPVRHIADSVRDSGVALHADATQAMGGIAVSVDDLGVDLLSLSGHKIYGPTGVGALYARRGVPMAALLPGGGQQRGLRGGTFNVAGIVGMGEACRILTATREEESIRTAGLRDRLQSALIEMLPDAEVNGDQENRLPNNLSLSVPGLVAASLMASLPDVIFATTSACSSGGESHVLQAIGQRAEPGTLRLSVGRHTTVDDVDYAARELVSAIRAATGSVMRDVHAGR
ncbi:cysteine desulfurase family protein [Actinokineospora xionganensis]|uniref:cysteine desulfurase n=1 Tax=Actinokineospora xionganensis TaxID=2684470 RepID=A0ABR7L0R4_9PSEU|nr:cysteine desulfurase family protein [Actinokineospora xionganensis]MBC6445957.1 cysteine desulfurase [Actinokineospora xionganensis]